MKRLILLLVSVLLLTSSFSYAEHIYIAQNSAGSNNGAACKDAHAYTWFNTLGNWANPKVTGKIGQGDTIHLCGIISSELIVNGSGSSGSVITILFETGSKLSQAAGTLMSTGGNSYLLIDGGTNGVIENTNNGSPSGGYANQLASSGIIFTGSTNLEVRNITFQNLYVHTDVNDTASAGFDLTTVGALYANGHGSDISIHNNTFHDICWIYNDQGASAGATGIHFYNNTLYNYDHGLAITGSTTGLSGIDIYNNIFGTTVNWDTSFDAGCTSSGRPWACCTGKQTGTCPLTTTSQWHHDGLHIYLPISPARTVTGLNVYNNIFNGDWGVDNTAHIYLEGQHAFGGTNTGISNMTVYNNVFWVASGRTMNNGMMPLGIDGGMAVYNNTFVGGQASGGNDICINVGNLANGTIFENNIVTSCGQLMSAAIGTTSSFDYNLYANGGTSNRYVWRPNSISGYNYFTSFATWQSDIGADAHSSYSSSAGLNGSGYPQFTSPAIAAGANLTFLGVNSLNSDKAGMLRPINGKWDIGAYKYDSSAPIPSTPVLY